MKNIVKTEKSHKKPGMFYGFTDCGECIDLRYEYNEYFVFDPEKLMRINALTKFNFISGHKKNGN